MSLIKKSDVKNHLSARYRKEVHLGKQVSQPDATGFSKAEPGAGKVKPSVFAEDFNVEHSFPCTGVAPSDPLTDSNCPQAPAASKSAQT